MAFTKITAEDLANKGVIGLPDTPNLSTQAMQEKLDEIALDVIVPSFNNLVDELDAQDIPDKIASPNITNLRINTDLAIEYSDDDGETYNPTASSGHRIMDGSGTIYSQRSRMQFSNNCTIVDDEANNKTVIMVQQGEKGDKGDAATITIGTVVEGDDAAVTNTGSQTDAILNFTLPKGDQGDAATIQVGTVTTGTSASVTNRGTTSMAVFDFVLPKGDKGDTGQGINILGEYDTLSDLETAHPTGQAGNAYMVGTTNPKDLYIWDVDNSEWANQGALQGVKGDTGDAATITVGSVTSGSVPSVVNSGTTEAAIFDFTLPKGDQGEQGNAGTISVGTVTSGQTASVTNSGTATAAIFDFVLPKGDKGDQGNPTVVNGKSGNNITLLQTDITKKLTATLAVGATTLTFTDDYIGNNSLIDVFSNPFGLIPTNMSQSGTTVTLTFDPQDVAYSVAITIGN